ncbi:hypothetical protein HGM15179_012083 [Zosterops borbonicus]|uniref:Uncharacterized protein n=1 Tax=Zosterops borbonicus TaxID=364589 RepID=A0A8K1LIF3_9PASS|nr:hypothetical protein HGM15179_012083 [Zosterops borbonicus]
MYLQGTGMEWNPRIQPSSSRDWDELAKVHEILGWPGPAHRCVQAGSFIPHLGYTPPGVGSVSALAPEHCLAMEGKLRSGNRPTEVLPGDISQALPVRICQGVITSPGLGGTVAGLCNVEGSGEAHGAPTGEAGCEPSELQRELPSLVPGVPAAAALQRPNVQR